MTTEDRGWLGLEGRVCVVTGAAGGIGKAVARAFVEAGAKVAVLDLDAAASAAAADDIASAAHRPLALACDVADADAVAGAARQVENELGACDVLVNNAGILRPGVLAETTIADWERTLRVNLTAYLVCAQAFGAAMLARGEGALVHIASIAATEPQAFSGAYSTSKAGVAMLSRQLAFEWGPRGVRSNVVSPGMIRTPLSESFYQEPGITEAREAVVPLRRIGRPEDIADPVVFLASSRASYVNGQELVVDGGFAQTLMSHVPRPGHGPRGPA